MQNQQITEPSDNTAKPDKIHKSANSIMTKWINRGSSRSTKLVYFISKIERSIFHKHYVIEKNISIRNLGTNKADVISLT